MFSWRGTAFDQKDFKVLEYPWIGKKLKKDYSLCTTTEGTRGKRIMGKGVMQEDRKGIEFSLLSLSKFSVLYMLKD